FVGHGLDCLTNLFAVEGLEEDDIPNPMTSVLSRRNKIGAREIEYISAEPDPGETLDQVLEQFRSWLETNAPQTASQLRKGLSKEQIRAALNQWEVEQEWVFPFPESLFPLFKHFNGQRSTRTSLLPSPVGTPSGLTLGSLEDMNAWRNNESGLIYLYRGLEFFASLHIDAEVSGEFWNDQWFPFATGAHVTGDENLSFLLFYRSRTDCSATHGSREFHHSSFAQASYRAVCAGLLQRRGREHADR
ncbi:MAG: hypothetical protein E6K53_15335, partial [Gammaproteobacteria bacterium]